jgi:transposase
VIIMLERNEIKEKIIKWNIPQLYPRETNSRVKVRLLGMIHVEEGKSCGTVADIVKVSRSTIYRWLKRLMEEGLSGLFDKPGRGAKQKLSKKDEEAFKKAVFKLQKDRKGGRVKGEDIRQLLIEKFNVHYSLNGVYELLKRLKIVWITGRSKHPKSDPKVQEEFKDNFSDLAKKELPENVETENVDIWFQDEARVGQQGTVTRIWAEKGTRPRVVRQQQFDSVYIFGAVCPQKDEGVALVLPDANTESMNLHLQAISSAEPEGRHALVVMDRAPWHTTEKLVVPENITILKLPAYSPELNPVDRIWEQLRQSHLANRCYEGYESIVNACCEAWNSFREKLGAIKRLCFRKWAFL